MRGRVTLPSLDALNRGAALPTLGQGGRSPSSSTWRPVNRSPRSSSDSPPLFSVRAPPERIAYSCAFAQTTEIDAFVMVASGLDEAALRTKKLNVWAPDRLS
jgi:hypothetical protein